MTLTGASVTLTGADATSLDSVDASALTGTLTIGSGFTTAAGATITGGTAIAAVDSISMATTNIKNLVLGANSTAETGDDQLTLTGAMNSGTGTINLASSTDQITKLGGVDDTVVQTGINDVVLSGLTSTGSHGFHITAAATGSDITGSVYSDTIVLGDKADKVTFTAYSATVTDTITGFTNTGTGTTDTIDLDVLTTSTSLTGSLTTSTDATTIAANHVYLVTSSTSGAADSASGAATAIEAAAAWTLDDLLTYFVVVDDNSSAVFRFDEGAGTNDNTVDAAELFTLATIDATLASANIVVGT